MVVAGIARLVPSGLTTPGPPSTARWSMKSRRSTTPSRQAPHRRRDGRRSIAGCAGSWASWWRKLHDDSLPPTVRPRLSRLLGFARGQGHRRNHREVHRRRAYRERWQEGEEAGHLLLLQGKEVRLQRDERQGHRRHV